MKVLILRFSSFGDVVQCLSVPSAIAARYPEAEIHWATRKDLALLLERHPHIAKIWPYDRKTGAKGLVELIGALRAEGFTHVYDAHNTLRSRIISLFLWPRHFARKPGRRLKRFFLFKLRWNLFEQPFSGQRDLLEPLAKWDIPRTSPPPPQIFVDPGAFEEAQHWLATFQPGAFFALAPSAAHYLKRWPVGHWKRLIESMPGTKFVLLGGPEDRFLTDLAAPFGDRVLNLAGRTQLQTSAAIVALSRALITNDTGLLHVAEQLGHPAVALMGPAPFGFPSRPTTTILERKLPCRPCSKHGQGPCVNKTYQLCLTDISPDEVRLAAERIESRP